MPAGDILFYSGVSLSDHIIQMWTNSKLNHVAIDKGDGTKFEALNTGIAHTPFLPPYRIWSYEDNAKDKDPADMNSAIAWLESMVGKPYGWSDIASAAQVLNKFIYLVRPGFYDCSALACEFLVKAGGVDLGGLGLDPHLATPASLAQQLGVKA
jgi:uncharacterized protein YycO